MLMILDTETTAITPGQLAQVSYILAENGSATAKNFFFEVDRIDPDSAAVNGFTVEQLRVLSGGKRFVCDAAEILEDLETCDLLAAHNVNFDFKYLRTEFARCGITLRAVPRFDTMTEFTPVCRFPRQEHEGYKYPRLSELTAFLGIPDETIEAVARRLFGDGENFHDARFDSAAVYLVMLEGRGLCAGADRALRANGM